MVPKLVKYLFLILLCIAVHAQTVHTSPALDTNNTFTGSNAFQNITVTSVTDTALSAGLVCATSAGTLTNSGCGSGITGSGTAFQLPRWITSSTLGNSTFFAESNASPAAFICNGIWPTCTGASAILQGGAGGATNFTSEGNFIVETDNSGSGIFLRHGSAGTVAINDSKLASTPKLQLYGGTSGITLITTDAFNAGTTFNINNVAIGCGTSTTCSPSRPNNPRMLWGRVTLSGGTATVSSVSPAFSTVNSSECTASDRTTATNAANAVIASTSSITITGTGTDVISYICTGN